MSICNTLCACVRMSSLFWRVLIVDGVHEESAARAVYNLGYIHIRCDGIQLVYF
jgi:hypothetical protein